MIPLDLHSDRGKHSRRVRRWLGVAAIFLFTFFAFHSTTQAAKAVNGSGSLDVTVVNDTTGQPVPRTKVSVFKYNSKGKPRRVGRKTTNRNGEVQFRLKGLGSGDIFQIQANPYKNGVVIADGIEDVHSQVELLLTQALGDIGKKIHSGRS